jgi:hypothetical protein
MRGGTTGITNLLRAQPRVAFERAGHSRVGTSDRCGHVTPSLQADAALRIDAALRQSRAKQVANGRQIPILGGGAGS